MRDVIGLLVTPQNTAPMPTAAHSGIEHPKAEAKKGSECGADEKGWYDFTAFISGSQGCRSKNHF